MIEEQEMYDEAKQIPNSERMEKGIISVILQNPAVMVDEVVELGLHEEHFYNPARKYLFGLLLDMTNRGQSVDPISIMEKLKDDGKVDFVGGASELMALRGVTGTDQHLEQHVKGVKIKAVLRRIKKFGDEVSTRAMEANNEDIDSVLDDMETQALTTREALEGSDTLDTSMQSAIKKFIASINPKTRTPGIMTGFAQLDEDTGGIGAGEMMVIAARPSVGKSAMMINMASHMSIDNDIPGAYFAVEGNQVGLVSRIISGITRIDSRSFRNVERLSDPLLERAKRTAMESAGKPLRIDDRYQTAPQICSQIRRMKNRHGIKFVMVDYLQKIPASCPEERGNPKLRVDNALAMLHGTCQALGVSLIVAAQLNRQADDNNVHMGQLGDSSRIEQDADYIALLNNVLGKEDAENEETLRVNFNMVKNREGQTGRRIINFEKSTLRFSE